MPVVVEYDIAISHFLSYSTEIVVTFKGIAVKKLLLLFFYNFIFMTGKY